MFTNPCICNEFKPANIGIQLYCELVHHKVNVFFSKAITAQVNGEPIINSLKASLDCPVKIARTIIFGLKV